MFFEGKLFGVYLCLIECVSPNSYVEVLTPNVTAFENRAYMELIKVKQGHKGGTLIQ